MKNTEEFIEQMVKIEFLEQFKVFGHYPFSLFVEKKNGETEVISLALGGDVESCYKKFAEYREKGAVKIFLSLDFPRSGDMDNDFVAIFSLVENDLSIKAITYSTNTGEVIKQVENSDTLTEILKQFIELTTI